jgi:hypothetical protein
LITWLLVAEVDLLVQKTTLQSMVMVEVVPVDFWKEALAYLIPKPIKLQWVQGD